MPDKIKIMTYNIHSCFGADGTVTAERIAEVIAAAGADIIALQEVDSGLARSGGIDQALEIADLLRMNFHFHPSLQRKDGEYGNAVLSRLSSRLIKAGTLPNLPALRH